MEPIAKHYVRYIEKLHREGFSNNHISKITRLSRQTVITYVKAYCDRNGLEFSGEFRGNKKRSSSR